MSTDYVLARNRRAGNNAIGDRVAADMASAGELRIETGVKRVRALRGGLVVADTVCPLLVWEVPYYPTYYIPEDDIQLDAVADVSTRPVVEQLRGYRKLEWDAMDAWFEEDEEVYTHPRDPYVRVDILPSSRHIRIEVNGVTLADSAGPMLLFETNLPTRYYLPKTDVRLDLLQPSDTITRCPYEGQAEYWSVRTGEAVHADLVWSYRTPLPESERVAGLLCFADERVDLYLDGVSRRPAQPVLR